MTLSDKLYDVATEMAGKLEELCECAEESGSSVQDIEAILASYYQARNAILLATCAKQVVKDKAPPLHQLMGIEKSAGVNFIVPIARATTHKGQTYYQRKALA